MMKKKLYRVLCLLLIVMIIIPTGIPAFAAYQDYTDLKEGEWYQEAIRYCVDQGYMVGTGKNTFSPGSTMTRGMFVMVFYRFAGLPASKELTFTDCKLNTWYSPAIGWAQENGFIGGYGNGLFGPEDPITREQVVKILWELEGKPSAKSTEAFSDENKISSWALSAVRWAKGEEIIHGRGDNAFVPKDNLTRAEAAQIIYNYLLYKSKNGSSLIPDLPELKENTRDNSGYYRLNNILHYQGEEYHVGIDVSAHQGPIDWEKVKNGGVEFAMIRVGYRGYGTGRIELDECFNTYMEGALAQGIKVGVYFFSQAVNEQEAIEEAKFTLNAIKGYPISYPVVFDWERYRYETSRTKDTTARMITYAARAFCNTVKAAGYTPMTYSSPSGVSGGKFYLDELTDYPFWLAHYVDYTEFKYQYDMWQYGQIPIDGIKTLCDINISFLKIH